MSKVKIGNLVFFQACWRDVVYSNAPQPKSSSPGVALRAAASSLHHEKAIERQYRRSCTKVAAPKPISAIAHLLPESSRPDHTPIFF
jgi:hypothetical protein